MTIANRKLKLASDHCSENAVEVLRSLLKDAEEGALIGFTGVAEYRGSYRIIGSLTLSRAASAGALLDAAITRLNE